MPAPDAYPPQEPFSKPTTIQDMQRRKNGDPRNVIVNDPRQLPANLPTVPLGNPGNGWREVSIGEQVKTHYQFFSFAAPLGWRLTDFWTGEGEPVTGRTHYREPKSFRAWMMVLPELVAKAWKRLLKRKP